MLSKRRRGHDSSDFHSLEPSAEDVLMEVLMERNATISSDVNSLGPQGIFSAPTSEELEYSMEELHEASPNDAQIDGLAEAEFYEILQEIEQELQVDGKSGLLPCVDFSFAITHFVFQLNTQDEILLEEVLEEERAALESQINEYEELKDDMDEADRVICPLCTASHLHMSSTGDICCSDEYCPMCIRPFDRNNPLLTFKSELGRLFEEHSISCNGQLLFSATTIENGVGVTLLASCNSCNLLRQF